MTVAPVYATTILGPKIPLLPFCLCLLLMIAGTSCQQEQPQDPEAAEHLFGIGAGIQNIEVAVEDLDSALVYYKEVLGFYFRQSSDNYEEGIYDGSITASTSFPDLSSLTLVSLVDSVKALDEASSLANFIKTQQGGYSYELSTSSVDSTRKWLKSQGFPLDSIRSIRGQSEAPEGWSWDNGEADIKRLSFDTSASNYLPTFEEQNFNYAQFKDFKKTYFAYNRSFSRQSNGAVALRHLKVAVYDLPATRSLLRQMGIQEDRTQRSKRKAVFNIKDRQELHLLSALEPGDEIDQILEQKGEGLFGVTIEVANLEETYCFLSERLSTSVLPTDTPNDRILIPAAYAFGLQIEFLQEPKEQGLLAQQLKVGQQLDSATSQNMAGIYLKYCALCHGENREGYAADFAPSLRSRSLLASSKDNNFMRYTIQYGREGTAMAGYLNRLGGPLEYIEIELLLQWLYEEAEVEEAVEISREPVLGDLALGAEVYADNCSTCHGAKGEGISAPALGKPMLLATATDGFLRYAISEGRDSTLMPSFKDSLSVKEIDAVTAFLRSRASGWDKPQGDSITFPTPDEYVLNPDQESPEFELREGLYLPAEQLNTALQDSARIIILDARSKVAWRQTHIPGAVPVPYYEEPDAFIEDIPNDDTWVVVYCACPHAASQRVVNTLRRYGYQKTAIMDEGILVWAQMGFPVRSGQ